MGYSRDKLEENRKKKKLLNQVFQQSNFQETAQKLNDAAQSIKPKTNTTKTTAAKSSGSATKTNTVTQSTQKQQTGLSSFQKLGNVAKTVQSVGTSVLQKTNPVAADRYNLQKNMIAWHGTTDAATRNSLQKQNDEIRQRLGLSFDPSTGVTFDSKTGKNYSLPTQMLYGTSAGKRASTAGKFATSSTVLGQKSETQRGIDAHKTMADLYSRAAETWSDDDTRNRDNAREALADEMQNIMRQYGLQYSARSNGPNARFTVSDDEAIEKLRAAGADETTLAYVAENIQMREAADRLGQGIEAVAKRAIGSIPALIETSRQQSTNVEQSRQNAEYVQLEERAQQLEAQLQSMPSQDADGKVPADYMAVYNEWQDVRNRLNELAVKTPVDQNKWGQTMLREAAEAQANATAGLADVPRFLANTGISIAGNAPTMALSAIPGAGPVAGMVLMGASAAGQRAAELNAQGVSPDEALGRGLTSGIIEGVTEKLPLDEMAKLLKGGGTSAVRNILRQMGIEASEESASYLMNYAADLAANDPNAKFSFAELAQSALGGMVSGGFFGAAGTVIGGMRTQTGTVVGKPEGFSVPENTRPFYTETQQDDMGARMVQETPQTTQEETIALKAQAPQTENTAPTLTSAAQQQANTQTLGRRLAELDAEKRQAETLLPGPIRDRAIQQVEEEMQRVQREAAAQTTTPTAQAGTAAQTAPNVQVPADAAFQYGLSPETAMLEARERARNEAVQEAKDAGKTINLEDALKEWQSGQTETSKLPASKKVKNAIRYSYRNIVSGQAEIERFAKGQQKINPKAASANDLSQISRTAGSTVDTIAEKALVDRKGDAIGEGWLGIVQGLTEDELKKLNFYRLHKHNIDRMNLWKNTASQRIKAAADKETLENHFPFLTNTSSAALEDMARNNESKEIREIAREYLNVVKDLDYWQKIRNKPVIGRASDDGGSNVPYTAEESANIVREMEAQNPKIKEWADKAEAFHDAFMQEWAVGSGLMSQDQYNALKEKYPHYVQTYRVPDNWSGDSDVSRRGSVSTNSPIKEAVGDLSEIVPFEDAEMMQVNALVKNARRNELFQNIYEFAKANPETAAPYVRVTGENIEYQAPQSLDDLTGEMADAAMSEQGGIYTIRAMVDGKPIVMQVNADFYAGLQNLFGQDKGSSDSFMRKTFGTATNVFKQLTTGKNPLFFFTNLPKDFQTAYINTTSDRKFLVTYLADVAGTIKSMAQNSADWKAFQAMGGTSSGFYHNEKGFTQSAKDAGKHKIMKKLWGGVEAISENTEALWRFNEYRAAIKKYGNTQAGRSKAIQAAADVTTNFSRSAPATKAAENYCAYLNASVQGLDKIARQLKNHPFTTTRRAAEIIALPTLLLYFVNRDDEDYQDLNNRTKDNYFCIPIGDTGKFLKIPKSREYGVAMGALLERFFRLAEGEETESAFRGIGEQFFTNLAPSNPVTDNILKTFFIDLPTNRDFAGRSIVPERMSGLSPENQYDYDTSGAGMTLANAWNSTAGNLFGKISPMQVDYLIDSNLGFVGDAIIGATTNPKSLQEIGKEFKEDPLATVFAPFLNVLEQKFVADPMYQSGVTDAFYDELDAAERAKNDKNLIDNIAADVVTPEEKYYSELSKASSEISELRKQERELLADRSLTDKQREEQVRAIRRQINDIAKAAPGNAEKVRDEYEKTYIPEISYLEGERREQAQEAILHGVTAQQFADTDKRLKALTNEEDANGDKVRTPAEARGIVLDEVMKDSALSDSEKQAVADYVLISSMDSDTQKELWETVAKGKVNASDFLRFKSDISAYEEGAKGTGTDNMANVATILRGYDGLTDEQRDILFQTYNETMSNNPFHVSTYEKAIEDNSLYQSLTDEGKAALRALTNEYEQYINEGRELDEWRAKAYMAEKEAGIAPGIYALYRTVLDTVNAKNDGNTNRSQQEVETAINTIPGLTQYQKAYIWQSANKDWKKNPFGSATVTEYQSGTETAINPVANGTQTSSFGPREQPTAGASTWHDGLDIGASEGEPIKAILSGKVIAKDHDSGSGYYIKIDHGNGRVSTYMHMKEGSTDNINVGDEVSQGQQIGAVGSTGISTGPHLDIRITQDGKYVDPLTVIPGYGIGPSGYVSGNTAAASTISSGVAAAQSSSKSNSKSSSSSTSSGFKDFDPFKAFEGLGF